MQIIQLKLNIKIEYQMINNIQVWHETKQYFDKYPRAVPKSIKFTHKQLKEPSELLNTTYTPIVEVLNADSFNLALDYIKEGYNPLVLNMASFYHPGGGVAKGASTQEEDLFRRSNAHVTHNAEYYPLKKDEMIYSPQVTIARASRDQKYKFIKEQTVGMIACAALKKPNLINGNFNNRDHNMMLEKIQSLFLTGIQFGHDSLVLGALGCGAYGNPPHEIANMFKLMVNIYGKYFKKIGFGVLVMKDSDQNNYDQFKKLF